MSLIGELRELLKPTLHGSVSNQDIISWIYPDSAALQVGCRHRSFGFPKRETLVDAAREFLDEFIKIVDGPDEAARN